MVNKNFILVIFVFFISLSSLIFAYEVPEAVRGFSPQNVFSPQFNPALGKQFHSFSVAFNLKGFDANIMNDNILMINGQLIIPIQQLKFFPAIRLENSQEIKETDFFLGGGYQFSDYYSVGFAVDIYMLNSLEYSKTYSKLNFGNALSYKDLNFGLIIRYTQPNGFYLDYSLSYSISFFDYSLVLSKKEKYSFSAFIGVTAAKGLKFNFGILENNTYFAGISLSLIKNKVGFNYIYDLNSVLFSNEIGMSYIQNGGN